MFKNGLKVKRVVEKMITNSSQPLHVVLFLGFDFDKITKLLAPRAGCLETPDDISKIVIFDVTDSKRPQFEALYKIHKDKLTFYEGCIATNVNKYIEKHATYDTSYTFEGDLELLNTCKVNNDADIHLECGL